MKLSVRGLSTLAVLGTVASAQSTTENDIIVTVDGDNVIIPFTSQASYDSHQDQSQLRPLQVSTDGLNVTMMGNMHRSVQFPTLIQVTPYTTLDFDFYLADMAEVHALCLDRGTTSQDGGRCFLISGTQDVDWARVDPDAENSFHSSHQIGETRHYHIPIGEYFTDYKVKYLAFLQDNDSSNRDTGHSSFANIQIGGYGADVIVNVDGTDKFADVSKQDRFRGSQDTYGNPLIVSEDGKSATLVGNIQRVMPFIGGPVTVDINTNLDFDFSLDTVGDVTSLCLATSVDDSSECLVVANSESWGSHYMINPRAQEGDVNRHYTIPVGLLIEHGSYDYLALMQDDDNLSTLGNSTFTNIALTQVLRPTMTITMNDLPTLIDTAAVVPAPDENGGKQDSPTNFLKYDDTDVTAVTLKGNTWKAFPLPTPYQITEATEIHFDFDLISTGEIHGFCMYTSTMQMVGGRDNEACFQMAGTQNAGWQTTDHNQAEGAYTWRVGDKVQGEVAFIGYILDYDAGDKYSKGEHTISNFRMAERLPVSISIDGSPVVIPNNQLSYGSNQDFRDNLVEVSEGGSKISMYGNLWKALPFSSPVTVTENTVLSFTVSVDEVTDFVALCLEEDRTQGDEYRCFKLSGKQQSNLGPLIYRGINQVDEGNSYHYIIKLNSYFTGTMNYLTFLQDNDGAYNDGDRYAGVSHISNIRLYEQPAESCFANQDFTFSLTECTVDSFIGKISELPGCGDPWEELVAHFDTNTNTQVSDIIQDICTSANSKDFVSFTSLMAQENQFIEEFFDGGTTWNYEEGEPAGVARTQIVSDRLVSQSSGISLPDVHNFHGCELRAAMCCYVGARTAAGTPLSEPLDNSDACYMDFSQSKQSSHVRDGYSIYGNGVEGNLHCHGFAWGNDEGYGDAQFRGNTLFEIALNQSLHKDGYVEELPGAPMCGCIEQMPVVTRADCTKTSVVQTVDISYDSASKEFFADGTISNVIHEDCGSLESHYETLVAEGKATQDELNKLKADHLVEEKGCNVAMGEFLATKGFQL